MFLAPLEDLSGRPVYDLARACLRDGRDRFETADVRDILAIEAGPASMLWKLAMRATNW